MNFRTRKNKVPCDKTKSFIYQIVCPITNDVVYIGYTINPKSRFSYHLNNGFEFNKKALFIRWLLSKNLTPKFEIIKEFNSISEAKEYEKYLIKSLNPILNEK